MATAQPSLLRPNVEWQIPAHGGNVRNDSPGCSAYEKAASDCMNPRARAVRAARAAREIFFRWSVHAHNVCTLPGSRGNHGGALRIYSGTP
jgi:hypothetical protein